MKIFEFEKMRNFWFLPCKKVPPPSLPGPAPIREILYKLLEIFHIHRKLHAKYLIIREYLLESGDGDTNKTRETMENLISFCLCQVLFFQKKLSQYETSLRISKMIFICGSYCSDADAVSMHQICLAGDHRFSVLHSIVLTHFLTSRDLFLSH